VVELLTKFEADWSFLGNDGSVFYFLTTDKAPNRRIITVLLPAAHTSADPKRAAAAIVVSQRNGVWLDHAGGGESPILATQLLGSRLGRRAGWPGRARCLATASVRECTCSFS